MSAVKQVVDQILKLWIRLLALTGYFSGSADGGDAAGEAKGLAARVAVKVPAPRPTTWTVPVI